MSVALAQLRVMYLTLRQSDLNFKIQMITQNKMGLSKSMDGLIGVGTDLDTDSLEMKVLEQRKHKLHIIEQKLDMQMKRYQTELTSVETEMESAQKVLDGSIKHSFSYGGGGH